ncbi:GGDEF domain-containing protein [Hydrogenimonas sp.]
MTRGATLRPSVVKISLLTLAVFAVVFLSFYDFQRKKLQNSVVATVTRQVTATAETAVACLGLHESATSETDPLACLGPLQKDERVLSLAIVGGTGAGAFLAAKATPLDESALAQKRTQSRFDPGTGRLSLAVPFPSAGGTPPAALHIEYDPSTDLARAAAPLRYLARAALALLAAAAALLVWALRPYRRFVSALRDSLARAESGDFDTPVSLRTAEAPIAETAALYNRLLANLKETADAILSRFGQVVEELDIRAEHPLQKASKALQLLANVYRYRYAVERDRSVFKLYEEIVKIVRNVTQAEHFSLYSVDRKERIKTLIYTTAGKREDDEEEKDELLERMDIDEVAFQFPSLAPSQKEGIAFYFCIPIDIDEQVTLIVALFAKDRRDMDRYRDKALELRYYLQNIKPVIESKILTQKLKEQSLLDGLTGLYNRKFLEEFIDKIDNQAKRSQTRYAVLMIDIDFFKSVNDTFGHDVGDRFIRILGHIIQDHIRASDIAVRYGGEEFLVLLHESNDVGAMKVADAIRRDFANRTVRAAGQPIRKTLSVGIAFYPDHTVVSLRKAIKYADIALYRAKEEGRDTVVVFDESMLKEKRKG